MKKTAKRMLAEHKTADHDMFDLKDFTDEDRSIVAALQPVVRGLAAFWGDRCEVVLHSLEDLANSVVRIENAHVTGRAVGAPVTDLALQILRGTDRNDNEAMPGDTQYRVYSSKTADGRPLRSSTMVIRNGTRPIAMLCLNFDLSVPLHEILKTFAFVEDDSIDRGDSPEHYMMTADDLVTRSIDLAIRKATTQRRVSPQTKNRAIVGELYQQGIFDVKGTVELVSAELGVSRFTVYNYLRDLKNDREEQDDDE